MRALRAAAAMLPFVEAKSLRTYASSKRLTSSVFSSLNGRPTSTSAVSVGLAVVARARCTWGGSANNAARSMTLLSSRTLPGHGYSLS